jgi:hypothetical protein
MVEKEKEPIGLEVGVEQSALAAMRQKRPGEVPADDARRQRVLSALVAHVEQQPARLRRKRLLAYGVGLGLTAAASTALWLSLRPGHETTPYATASVQATGGELTLLRGEQQRALAAGESEQLAVSDRVHTAAGNATLTLPTGSRVSVSGNTTVQVTQLGAGGYETLRLLDGSIQVQVPKLATGEYFAVLTATSKVVVHGTRFAVDVGPRALPGAACVEVQEGLVTVHSPEAAHWLGPGESTGCRSAEEPTTRAADPKSAATPAAPDAPARAGGVAKAGGSAGPSADLAEQNRLFQIALTHQRRQQWVEARRAYEQLLRRFPDAPLSAEARVQLEKVQAQSAGE